MAQFPSDQVVYVLVSGVVQGFVLAGGCQERFDLFFCVRVEACDVVGFMCLSAVEVLVVFRFVSSHSVGSFFRLEVFSGRGGFAPNVAELSGVSATHQMNEEIRKGMSDAAAGCIWIKRKLLESHRRRLPHLPKLSAELGIGGCG